MANPGTLRARDRTHNGRPLNDLETHACDMLLALVLKSGLKVEEVAERLGISGSAVGQVLNGRFAPSLRTIEKMAAVLGHRVVVTFEPLTLGGPGG